MRASNQQHGAEVKSVSLESFEYLCDYNHYKALSVTKYYT